MMVGDRCHVLEPILFDEGFNLSTIVLGTTESDTISSGIPNLAMCALSLLITVVVFKSYSPNFEETREVIHCHHVTLLV